MRWSAAKYMLPLYGEDQCRVLSGFHASGYRCSTSYSLCRLTAFIARKGRYTSSHPTPSTCAHQCPHMCCISVAYELESLMVPPLAAHVRSFLLTSDCLSCTGHPSALWGDDRAYRRY